MKDIKTSYGGVTSPVIDGDFQGTKLEGVVVRNKGDRARRVTLMTDDTAITLGKDAHYADYSYTSDKIVNEMPDDGYGLARMLELTAARNYHPIFTFPHLYKLKELFDTVTGDKLALGQMTNGVIGLPPTELSFDNAFTASEMRTRGIIGNPYVSFSIRVKGKVSNISLDISKHPARVTADLNYYLGLLHPHLKGFFQVKDGEAKLFFATDSEVGNVGFPYVRINGDLPLNVPEKAPYRIKRALHIDNGVEMVLKPNLAPTTDGAISPLTTYHEDTPLSLADNFANALRIGNGSNASIGENLYRVTFNIPANEFKPFALDPRYYIKLVGINSLNGSSQATWALKNIQYQDTAGGLTPAELMPIVADYNLGGGTTFLINKRLSLAAGFLTADLFDQADKDIELGEVAGLTGDYATKYGLTAPDEYYVAILAPFADSTQSSPMFRKPTAAVKVTLDFENNQGTRQVINSNPSLSFKYEDVAYGLGYDLSFDAIQGTFNGDMVLGLHLNLFNTPTVATEIEYIQADNAITFRTPGLNFTKLFAELGYQTRFNYSGYLEFMHRSKNKMAGYTESYYGEITMKYPSTAYYFPAGETAVYVRERPDLDLAVPFDLVGVVQGGLNDRPWEFATSVEWEFQIDDQPVLTPLNATKLPGAANLGKTWGVGLNRADFEALIDDAHVIKITVKAKFPWLAQPVTYKGTIALNVRKYIPPEEGLIAEESTLAIMLPKNVTGYTIRDADSDVILIDVENVLVQTSADNGVPGDDEGVGEVDATLTAELEARVYEDQWYQAS